MKATVTYILTDGVAKQDKGYLRAIMSATTDKVLSPALLVWLHVTPRNIDDTGT